MPATKRTITGKLLRPDGSAWANTAFIIRLIGGFSLEGIGNVLPGILEVSTGTDGAFSTDLYPNPAGQYEVILPTGRPWFKFILPPGTTTIELEDLQDVGESFVKPSEADATNYPLVIEKGQPFKFEFTYRDKQTQAGIDLSSASATFTVKDDNGGTLLALVSPTNITLNTPTGHVEVNMTTLETTALTFTEGEYNLTLTFSDQSKKTFFLGPVTVA